MFAAYAAANNIEAALEAELVRFGLKTDVLVRNGTGINEVIRVNPFVDAVQDRPSHALVPFDRRPFPSEVLERLREAHRT
jgi:uncharacterized protein (DUF1697 family)